MISLHFSDKKALIADCFTTGALSHGIEVNKNHSISWALHSDGQFAPERIGLQMRHELEQELNCHRAGG